MKSYKVVFKLTYELGLFQTLWEVLPSEVWSIKQWNYKDCYDMYTLTIFCKDFTKFQQKNQALLKKIGSIERYNEVKITSDVIYSKLQSVINTLITLSPKDIRWVQKQAQSYIHKAFKMLKEVKKNEDNNK